jgi:hypothetical protein
MILIDEKKLRIMVLYCIGEDLGVIKYPNEDELDYAARVVEQFEIKEE